jgi:hypothetical protein
VKKEKTEKRKKKDSVVLLEDLAPRKEVKGGSGKIVFGQGGDPFSTPEAEKKDKKK